MRCENVEHFKTFDIFAFYGEGGGGFEKSIAPKYVGAARTSMAIATKWDYGQKIIIKSHDCSYPFVFHKLSRLTFNLREVI